VVAAVDLVPVTESANGSRWGGRRIAMIKHRTVGRANQDSCGLLSVPWSG
jgi:hypothetical protein